MINTSTNLISNLFVTKVLFLDIKTLRNNQIPPIKNKDNLISQAMFSFKNEQFKALLMLLTVNDLDILLATLKPYQINDLITIENFIGVL